jgi:hypothetical protein
MYEKTVKRPDDPGWSRKSLGMGVPDTKKGPFGRSGIKTGPFGPFDRRPLGWAPQVENLEISAG